MISVEHVAKRFGPFLAVDNLSFEVARNESVALWGPNGAGKTTVIKCLLGLLRFDGAITLDGSDVRRDGRAVRRALGYVPQELAFYEDLGTRDTARFYAKLKRVGRERVDEVLDDVGLAHAADKPVGALSGGMKQRLALALALLADPPVLVLDEPTSNLDAAARDSFLDLLTSVKTDGKTVLFTSHRLEEVEALADWVLVMEEGRERLRCASQELAARVSLHKRIRLRIDSGDIAAALRLLEAEGLAAHRNGKGLLVSVPAGAKASPINLLARADIPVHDFEVE